MKKYILSVVNIGLWNYHSISSLLGFYFTNAYIMNSLILLTWSGKKSQELRILTVKCFKQNANKKVEFLDFSTSLFAKLHFDVYKIHLIRLNGIILSLYIHLGVVLIELEINTSNTWIWIDNQKFKDSNVEVCNQQIWVYIS